MILKLPLSHWLLGPHDSVLEFDQRPTQDTQDTRCLEDHPNHLIIPMWNGSFQATWALLPALPLSGLSAADLVNSLPLDPQTPDGACVWFLLVLASVPHGRGRHRPKSAPSKEWPQVQDAFLSLDLAILPSSMSSRRHIADNGRLENRPVSFGRQAELCKPSHPSSG